MQSGKTEAAIYPRARVNHSILRALLGSALVVALASCTTTPETRSEGGLTEPEKNDIGAVIVPQFDDEDVVAAYATGVGKAIGSAKMLPDLPDELAERVMADPRSQKWHTDFMKFLSSQLGDQLQLESVVIAIPAHSTQKQKIMDFYSRTQPIILTHAILIDLETEEVIGFTRHVSVYSQNAGASAIAKAGNSAISDLIKK